MITTKKWKIKFSLNIKDKDIKVFPCEMMFRNPLFKICVLA